MKLVLVGVDSKLKLRALGVIQAVIARISLGPCPEDESAMSLSQFRCRSSTIIETNLDHDRDLLGGKSYLANLSKIPIVVEIKKEGIAKSKMTNKKGECESTCRAEARLVMTGEAFRMSAQTPVVVGSSNDGNDVCR